MRPRPFRVRPDQNASTSLPSGCTTGITPVTGMRRVTCGDQVRPPSSECCSARKSSSLDEQRVREVAAAAERARRAVVAGEPVLVVGEVRAPRQRRVGRGAPREAVRRAVDRQPRRIRRDRERVREPDAVRRVVGDHRIARPHRWPTRGRVRGQPRQRALAPGPAAVLRGREADARGAAGAVASDLEHRDRRLADRLRVRLDLGLVLALGVRVPVAVNAAADDLAVGFDPVAGVGGRRRPVPRRTRSGRRRRRTQRRSGRCRRARRFGRSSRSRRGSRPVRCRAPSSARRLPRRPAAPPRTTTIASRRPMTPR